MIPLWVIPHDWSSITAGTFLIQAAVNGAWGVMPILLNEYAPPQFRGVFPGTVYQLGTLFTQSKGKSLIETGNMLSAPAAQIQTVAASNWIKDTPHNGPQPNYSQVMAIVMSIVFTVVAILTSCGQERLGSHFELARRAGESENIEAGEETMKGDLDLEDDPERHKSSCVHQEAI